jgi:hypothetical protein
MASALQCDELDQAGIAAPAFDCPHLR